MKLSDKITIMLIKWLLDNSYSIYLPRFHMEFDNQSWSESDVFQLTPNDWTIEYEIKTSIQDLKSDFNKTLWYNHVVMPKHKLMLDGKRFNRFYFVIPIEFIKHNVMNMIPNKYGIITYDLTAEKQNIFKYYRKAKILHKNKITNRNYVINAVIKKYYFIYIKYIEQQIKTKEKTKCEEKIKAKIKWLKTQSLNNKNVAKQLKLYYITRDKMYKAKHEEIVSDLFMLPFTAFQGVYETKNNQIFMIFSDNTPITNNHIKEITKIINKYGKAFTYEIYIHSTDLETNIYNLCMLITIKEVKNENNNVEFR